ncbi:hypothetical protein [Sulfuriroseicoccus oceanibius]|uniref:Uncharacterized protein n=1 Tax=Sulfuriroseicoccus oceanibius TaxID=2707525 RepID=A0A6B3L152_9BACT|nr:hypothetical protein [Sulfuriroseicoccus oceanibius]QQL43723.1 hypothetical protein G3M56_007365 [Sulfuriroseicoccus oceanibius]
MHRHHPSKALVSRIKDHALLWTLIVLQLATLTIRHTIPSTLSWWAALAPLTIGLTALLCILSARSPLDGEHVIKRPSSLIALLSSAQVWLLVTRYLLTNWTPGIAQCPWWMAWSPSLILLMVFAIRAIGSKSKSR